MKEAAYNLVHEWTEALSPADAAELAVAVADSGRAAGGIVELPKDAGPCADCPSTGGLGSLTTLLAPLLIAADGIAVPKISADGSVAGAIDSMRLIPGFRTRLSPAEFASLLTGVGIVHIEQSEQFCPADRVLVEERRTAGKMENIALAAISLLGKKLVVPGCVAAFDFRVGKVGNIGESAGAAREAARFFSQVAESLDVRLAVVATDNTYPLCSAIGRIESLELLWNILADGRCASALDQAHLDTCIRIAAKAVELARQENDLRSCEERILRQIGDGTTRRLFEQHLEAQGSQVSHLLCVLKSGCTRQMAEIRARSAGRWTPPNAATLKAWFKEANRAMSRASLSTTQRSIEGQVGIRLLVSPGEFVARDQPVMLAAWPAGIEGSISPPPWGSVGGGGMTAQVLF